MKKAVLAIILIVIVLAAGAVWLYRENKAPSAQIEAKCREQLSENAKFVSALMDSSGASCALLADEADSATCTAWATRDASKCPEARKQTCAPVALRDPASCPDDPWCKALASEDASLCSNETLPPGDQQECAAWVNHDEKFFGATTECKEGAQAQAAVTTNNPALCNKISDKTRRELCLRNAQGIV